MDAINNCVWTIDLNLNGSEQNEEALFQTCVFKDWITFIQFFVLKAKPETVTDIARGWQLRTFCLFILYESGHLVIGHNWVVTVCKLKETQLCLSLDFLPTLREGQSHLRKSTIKKVWQHRYILAFLGYAEWARLRISSGKKNVKKKPDKEHERKWLAPLPWLAALSKAKGELLLLCCQFLLHNFWTFRDSSAWNSVLSEKSWRARSDKKKLSQNTTAESLEIFLRIVYPEGEKGDKKKFYQG